MYITKNADERLQAISLSSQSAGGNPWLTELCPPGARLVQCPIGHLRGQGAVLKLAQELGAHVFGFLSITFTSLFFAPYTCGVFKAECEDIAAPVQTITFSAHRVLLFPSSYLRLLARRLGLAHPGEQNFCPFFLLIKYLS